MSLYDLEICAHCGQPRHAHLSTRERRDACSRFVPQRKDSPGMDPGQATDEDRSEDRTVERVEPGPGDGVTSPARVSDEPVEALLRAAAPEHDAGADACAERVRGRLFGGGT